MNTITSGIFLGFDWFIRIVKLNLLWLLSSMAGLLIFSFFPATAAAFAVTNEWTKGNVDVSIWNTFKTAFKNTFWKSQKVGYFLGVVYFIIIVDHRIFLLFDQQMIWKVIMIILSILILLFVIVNLYIFPIITESNLGVREAIKIAFFKGAAFIHWTIINLFGVLAIGMITLRYPAVLLFLTGSSTILWLTCMNQIVNRKIEMKFDQLKGVTKKI